MPIPWERPLSQRPSAERRLAGIDVFHDFVWPEIFGHNLGAFPHGQSLSQMVRRECPDGKRPTLVLTTLPSAHATTIETADRYVAIVPIFDYMTSSGADPAATYYARASGSRVTSLTTLRDVAFSSQELQQFLATQLTDSVLREWMGTSPAHRQLLIDLVGSGLTPPAQSLDIESAPFGERQIDDAALRTLIEVLRLQPVTTYAQPLLELLTASPDGRVNTTLALATRLSQRIADVRAQLVAYSRLVETSATNEMDIQIFLERHPWIVGLHYVRARGRVAVPRGAIDFILDRFDGFFDIVELKGPSEPIVIERDSSPDDARPGSASRFTLSPALGNALAQAHLYRSILGSTNNLRSQYGLSDTRQPRILILIGLSTGLTAGAQEVLREINISLHRVEIVPYDLLGVRMTGLLTNLEALIANTAS
jgi:hypothetical protein